MENVDNDKEYKSLNGLLYYGFSWLESKEGQKFWSEVYKLNTAPYSDLKHLDNSYVSELVKPPVMWRKIDPNDIPTDVVLCANEDKSKIVINRIGVNALDGTIQSNNRREFFEVNYYIPLSDLINLPIQP